MEYTYEQKLGLLLVERGSEAARASISVSYQCTQLRRCNARAGLPEWVHMNKEKRGAGIDGEEMRDFSARNTYPPFSPIHKPYTFTSRQGG